ncbi:MAG: GGDEF domain-containing protein [Rhodoferax sp.]
MSEKKPFEIARETLKQLTLRKLVPTPGNYQALYHEIAEIPVVPAFPSEILRDISQALPTKTPGQQKQRGLLDSAIERMHWDGVKNALIAYGGFVPPAGPEAAKDARASYPTAETPAVSSAAITADFLAQIARLIEYAQPALGSDDEHFVMQTTELLKVLKQPGVDVASAKVTLVNYSHRLSFTAEDQAEIKKSLLHLLHLVFQNIAELSLDEQWLKGQMDALMEAAKPPLSLRRLDDVERRLKDVIFKQKDAKGKAMQAQQEMRQMLATFIERLSQITQSTGDFHASLLDHARQIEHSKRMDEIAPVLKQMVGATHNLAAQGKSAADELKAMRSHVAEKESELVKLHKELDRVSSQARHDPLTGALNRKGMDETLDKEVSNMRRKEVPLSVAMLDIDNFKKINDSLGHETGDEALAHLASVARECMRPQDSLARYGGEEFVILLPDTVLEQAVQAMTRLQRELSRRYFLTGTEKILITFSAGVAQVGVQESGGDAVKRADQAMYLAKRSGKNRVIAA